MVFLARHVCNFIDLNCVIYIPLNSNKINTSIPIRPQKKCTDTLTSLKENDTRTISYVRKRNLHVFLGCQFVVALQENTEKSSRLLVQPKETLTRNNPIDIGPDHLNKVTNSSTPLKHYLQFENQP